MNDKVLDNLEMQSIDYFLIGFVIAFYALFIWGYYYLKKKKAKESKGSVDCTDDILQAVITVKQQEEKYQSVRYLGEFSHNTFTVDNRHFSLIGSLIGGITSVLLILMVFSNEGIFSLLSIKMVATIPLCATLFLFYISISNPTEIFIFDRQKGTVTYPTGFMRKRTLPFSQAVFIHGYLQNGAQYIGIRHANGVTWSNLAFDFNIDAEIIWSFLVWYMDKNRPLPPGEELNTYRQEDYERRKAEGFPKPLYMAKIAMTDVDGNTVRYKAN